MMVRGGTSDSTRQILAVHDAEPWLTSGQLAKRLGLTRNQAIGVLTGHRRERVKTASPVGPEAFARLTAPPPHLREGGPRVCCMILDARPRTMPAGDGVHDPNWRFCSRPVKPGSSWCGDHHAIVYGPAPVDPGAPSQRADGSTSATTPAERVTG